jgi:hypothetical protein
MSQLFSKIIRQHFAVKMLIVNIQHCIHSVQPSPILLKKHSQKLTPIHWSGRCRDDDRQSQHQKRKTGPTIPLVHTRHSIKKEKLDQQYHLFTDDTTPFSA